MRLRLRLLLTLLFALARARIGPLEASTLRLRVLPNDVDFRHVTNDRYLAYMDLGRNDLVVRLGLLGAIRERRAVPVVRALSLRFRRPARLFARLVLRTRVVCWDAQSAWFEQEFFVAGRSIALAYCRAEMRAAGAAVPMNDLLAAAGHPGLVSPGPPPIVRLLEDQERAMQQKQNDDAVPPPTGRTHAP